MAGFSYQHKPAAFYLDPSCMTNVPSTSTTAPSIKNLSGFVEEAAAGNLVVNPNCFSQFYPLQVPLRGRSTNPPPPPPPPLDVNLHGFYHVLDQTTCKAAYSGSTTATQPSSVTKNQQSSRESSAVVENLESGEQVTQKVMTSMNKKRKNNNNGSSLNSSQSKDAEEGKSSERQKKCNATEEVKGEEKKKQPKAEKKDQKKVTEEPPTGYIHVRARRGQATDSHSLAERVRREKISERMKILQDLVPGCDKVTGKALMLDQIINYVQSLQNQVEFLSMKLASVIPMFYDYGLMDLDAFMIRPERLSSMAPQQQQLPSVQQCSPTAQSTAFSDANIITTTATATATATASTALATAANWSYPTTPHDAATLLLQGQWPCDSIDQDISSLLWDVEDPRQNFLNPSAVGFTNNNLCSFH